MPLPIAGLGLRAGVSAVSAAVPSGAGPRGFSINVETDVKAAIKQLKRVGERNLPLAIAQSLTATAKHLRKVHRRTMPRYIDKPTRFTQNGLGLEMARWRDFKRGTMYARVFGFDDRQEYMKFLVHGGRRLPEKRAIVVPGKHVRLNKHGNLTRKFVKTQLAKENTFVGTVLGVNGVWQRFKRTSKGQRLKLLVMFAPETNYRQIKWPFYKISAKIVDRELPKQINKAVRRALNKGR